MKTPRDCFPGIFRIPYDILDIEKCSGNQKFGLAGCEKMAMKETIVSQMRFGLVFDNVLWSKPLVSLQYLAVFGCIWVFCWPCQIWSSGVSLKRSLKDTLTSG